MGDHWLSDSTSILLYSVMFDSDSLQPLIQKILKLDLLNLNVFDFGFDFSLSVNECENETASKPTTTLHYRNNICFKTCGSHLRKTMKSSALCHAWAKRKWQLWWFIKLNISTQCNNTTVTLFWQLISELRADFHQRTQQQVSSHWIWSYKLDASMALNVMAGADRF